MIIEARILKLDRPASSGEKWKALVVVDGNPSGARTRRRRGRRRSSSFGACIAG